MRTRFFIKTACSLILFWLCLSTTLQANIIPAAPQIGARSYVVMDANSGQVILAKNEHVRYAPASLVKIMTSYLAEMELINGNLSESEMVRVSEKAWRTGGSRMFIQEGTQVPLIDILRGVIVSSGNDASIALAEHMAGSEMAFVSLMNQQAQRLNMQNTLFQNATGLPADEQYSTAYDMAILARALIQNSKQYYPLYAEQYYEFNDIRQPNRNKLLFRDDSVDGIKTGHTTEAGYCLVASAVRDGMRLITVVMGSNSEESRAAETQQLLNYTYRFYESEQFYTAGERISRPKVWKGETNLVSIGVAEDLAIALPRGAKDRLQTQLNLPKYIEAPIAEGQSLGNIQMTLDGEVIKNIEVVALQSIKRGSLFKRLWHSVQQFFLDLIG